MSIFGQFLAPFDDDGLIPCYGFGDRVTAEHSVFAFHDAGGGAAGAPEVFCDGLAGVLAAYSRRIGSVTLAGPTSFAPAIRKTMELVRRTTPREFTFALIIADGDVNSKADTVKAIIEASALPISIVCIGVGDGPWDKMEEFDDELHSADANGQRQRFDNFHFTEHAAIVAECAARGGNVAAALVRCAAACEGECGVEGGLVVDDGEHFLASVFVSSC
jgi:hypothetical protein